ncbi:MAG: hypothetical protein ACI8RZ_006932 [Myxococcota bacterium]|jgi:hypothetical protein
MLLFLIACTSEPEPTAPPAPPTPRAEPAPPTQPPVPPTSPQGQLIRIEAMRSRCEVSCDRLLTAATSAEKPLESREVLWWSLSAASVPDEVRAQIEAAAADFSAAPPELWRPMAANLAHTDSGQATLTGLMKTGEDAQLRAAAACAMLSGVPVESWRDYTLDDEAINAMGICATPWPSAELY